MKITHFAGASVASLVTLLLLNMFVFPLFFPGGVATKFANVRPEPLLELHLAAFVSTAILLTAICAVSRRVDSIAAAAGIGALVGVLASLPSSLHTVALTIQPISSEITAILWTTVTWAVAAGVAHRAYRWQKPS